jgi:putative membrane protein
MTTLTQTLIALVASLHILFLVLEMFLWTKPYGRKVFRLTPEFARETAALAANQGLYNGFLAAGLLWSLFGAGPTVATFFLACVVTAGCFGALTVNRRIFFLQAVPAIAALATLLWT